MLLEELFGARGATAVLFGSKDGSGTCVGACEGNGDLAVVGTGCGGGVGGGGIGGGVFGAGGARGEWTGAPWSCKSPLPRPLAVLPLASSPLNSPLPKPLAASPKPLAASPFKMKSPLPEPLVASPLELSLDCSSARLQLDDGDL